MSSPKEDGAVDSSALADAFADTEDFVTFTIADQLFGIPVLKVQDVLSSHNITRIPLAPPEIAGSLNLRGRIVTAMDVRLRLGLPPRDRKASMSIVAEHDGELYSLQVHPDTARLKKSVKFLSRGANPGDIGADETFFSDL